jgi:hypothetical protein
MFLASVFLGLLVWVTTSTLTGEPEAWDSGWYWAVSYPLLLFLSAGMGYLAPRRTWRWAVGLVLLVPLVNLIRWPAEARWLPLGLLAALMVAIPLAVSARLGSFARRVRESRVGPAL